MNFKRFLDELRKKSKEEKKIILWAIMIPISLLFFLLWINIVKNSINNLSKTKFPEIETENFLPQENIEEIKKFFDEENLKKIIESAEKEKLKEEKN